MQNIENIVQALRCCSKESDYLDDNPCTKCPYNGKNFCNDEVKQDAITVIQNQNKKIKALRLLIEWATECGFGFDYFCNEYNKYKDKIKNMNNTDAMIFVAEQTLNEDTDNWSES